MVFICLGSNIGNRLSNLQKAVELIKERCLTNAQCSIILETAAVLQEASPKEWDRPFLNMIVGGETSLSPQELLSSLRGIEQEMGRPQEREKWAPRIIDLDIILYKDLRIGTNELTIPHVELGNRGFIGHLLGLMGVQPWSRGPNIESPFSRSYVLGPQLIGVVNITKDSFSDGGKFYDHKDAVEQIMHLSQDGASIIEIGAQSTRPGAVIQPMETEQAKLEEVLGEIKSMVDHESLRISVDTFHPSIALALIKQHDIFLINDVGGQFDDDSLRAIAESGCKFCLMHSMGVPPKKDVTIPHESNPLDYLLSWGASAIERLMGLGFSREQIILDPGIGFGKTIYQNIEILQDMQRLRGWDCQIMLGHSRKSYIQAFSAEPVPSDRDMETISISLATSQEVDFLRVHNVRDHMKAMVANHIVKGKTKMQ